MNRRKPITARQLAREKLLFRYSSALERGDFDTLAIILREAEADPTLEKMLAEMDAVYRAELAPLPVLPTLSSNHNHRHTREDETMNVTYPTISRRLPDTRSRGRWNSAATLAAAMIALVLFAAILIARRPPTDPQQGNPGIVMQNETATPFALTPRPLMITATQFPTFTPTPLILHPIVSMTPTPDQFSSNPAETYQYTFQEGDTLLSVLQRLGYTNLNSDIVDQVLALNQLTEEDLMQFTVGSTILLPRLQVTPTPVQFSNAAIDPGGLQISPTQPVNCVATIFNLWESVNLLSQPDLQGIVIGQIPSGVVVDGSILQVTENAVGKLWLFVRVSLNTETVQGWVEGDKVTLDSPCYNVDILNTSDPCAITPVVVLPTFTLTWTPTPAPGLQNTTLEPLYLTATAVVEYATAMAQSTMLQPTIVPPCIIQTPPTLPPEIGVPSIPLDRYIFYTVQFGDTLLSLITTYSITLEEIAFLNPQLVFNTCDFTLQDGGTNCNALPAPGGTIKLPIPNIPINATPIAVFDMALRDGGYVLLTTEQVGDIPANALVRINSAQYNGSEWLYDVIAKDGETRGQAHEWQLQYAPDFVPGAVTPTAIFDGALGSGFYAAVTNQAVGNIPAGTRVQIGSAFYNGVEWNYNISDASGQQNTARESQLDFAPDYTPGMATPTAAYFDLRGQILITLVQVGSIPARTPVQATSGYYDGNEWVYGIMTLDSSAFADARASQLQAVFLDEAGVPPSPIPPTLPPTSLPTFTLTPIS